MMELADVLNQILGALIFMAVLVLTPVVIATKPARWLRAHPRRNRACAEGSSIRRMFSWHKCRLRPRRAS
jgi:hypothetical protein